jgi:soluble lytic murein transglycosylase-like protein
MPSRKTPRPVFLFLLTVPAFAGESAVLSSGLRMQVDRHEESGEMVRLYRGEAVTEMPKTFVVAFEPDEAPPALSPPPAPAPPGSLPLAPAPLGSPPLAPAPPGSPPLAEQHDLRTLVREAAVRAGLPPAFVESVAKTESAFNPAAVSPKGAIGVMQLMPSTAKALGADPNDPAQNIDAGARLLRELLLKYNGDVVKALAAYNAGAGAVDRYQGVPPYPETQHYVNTVVNGYLKAGSQ